MSRIPKVFLVNPAPPQNTVGWSFITPRWLFVIAAAVPAALVGDPMLIDEAIERFDPYKLGLEIGDIVGIGITTDNCLAGYEVARKAKAMGARIVMGGIHATLFPDEVLSHGADIVVTGNGDLVFGAAIEAIVKKKVLQKIIQGGQVPGEQTLEARWDLLDQRGYRSRYFGASVQTVIGCPERCSFCSVWRTEGHYPRMRLIDKIVNEVQMLKKMGFFFIIFADDNFNPATLGRIEREKSPKEREMLIGLRKERLEFFAEYKRRIPNPPRAFTQMTSEVATDPEYLTSMRNDMGICGALVGIESPTIEGLKSARKEWNPAGKEMMDVIRKVQAAGIYVLGSMICGLESDTPESIAFTGDFAKESGMLFAQFTRFAVFPGTVDYEEYKQDILRREDAKRNPLALAPRRRIKLLQDRFWLDPEAPLVVIDHPNMSRDTLVAAVRKNWDSFYAVRELLKRIENLAWPRKQKVILFLIYIAFKARYAGYGISADSVRRRNMKHLTALLMKAGMGLLTRYREKKVYAQ